MKSAQGSSVWAARKPQALGLWYWGVLPWKLHRFEVTPGFVLSINIIISSKDGASQTYEHHICLQKRFTVGVPQIRRESWFLEASNTHFLNSLSLLQKRSLERLLQMQKGLKTLNYTQKQTKRSNQVFLRYSAKDLCSSLQHSPLQKWVGKGLN